MVTAIYPMVTVAAGIFRDARVHPAGATGRPPDGEIRMCVGSPGVSMLCAQRARPRREPEGDSVARCAHSWRHCVAERPKVALNQREKELRF